MLQLQQFVVATKCTFTTKLQLNVFESGNLYFKGIQKFILFHDKNWVFF